ncbi:MAG: hypothetical protein KDA75_05625 [Planctomycetaceae bacterium]|nr:hypothetical protein [Planctomycetaceae bacterium]
MAISVQCPHCSHDYTVKDDAAGRKFKCKECGAVVEVPAAAGVADDEFGDLEVDFDADGTGDLPPLAGKKRRRRRTSDSTEYAGERLKAPAICLIVVAGLSIAFRIVDVGLVATGVAVFPQFGQGPNQANAGARQVGAIIGGVVGVAFNVVVLLGAIKMLKLDSLAMARTSAIISVIPCCSPCLILGIPFGIWALVVLNDPDVRDSFAA